MSTSFIRTVLARRAVSLGCAASLGVSVATLLDLPLGLLVVSWAAFAFIGLRVWRIVEGAMLGWFGARKLNRFERERIAAVTDQSSTEVLIEDAGSPFLVHGYRHVVVSRGLLDLLEDRALVGMLTQATDGVWPATIAGEALVWLTVLPFVGGWLVGMGLTLLGRCMAVPISYSLVLPMILWRDGFVRCVGALLGPAVTILLGTVLVASGMSAAGLVVLVGWAAVPGVRAVLTWEWKRTEAIADNATLDAGLGWHLLEALEVLAWVEPGVCPAGLVGLLLRVGTPVSRRAERIWRDLAHA